MVNCSSLASRSPSRRSPSTWSNGQRSAAAHDAVDIVQWSYTDSLNTQYPAPTRSLYAREPALLLAVDRRTDQQEQRWQLKSIESCSASMLDAVITPNELIDSEHVRFWNIRWAVSLEPWMQLRRARFIHLSAECLY
jgi:hypothetical protein